MELQELMLPVAPTAEQIQHCSGDSAVLWQRLGFSLLVTLATLKVSALAAGSLTFPLWYPSLQATLRNRNVRGKFRCAQPALLGCVRARICQGRSTVIVGSINRLLDPLPP